MNSYINMWYNMLKQLQKVRDVLEEVAHVYVETTVLGDALKEEGEGKDIETMCNDMIHKDIGFCEYLEVHRKLYLMLGYITSTNGKVLNEWIAQLYNADDECCRFVFNIMNI